MPKSAIAVGALIVAAIAAAWPYLAFPALLAVLLAAIVYPRGRFVVGFAGGALVAVALVRFAIEIAVPNIVGSGQRAAEEKAVSRLREIRWAALRAHETTHAWPSLVELAGRVMLSAPLTRTDNDAFICEGYVYSMYPNPTGFVAYAWPRKVGQTGFRAFAVDAADHICRTSDRATGIPTATAAMDAAGICARGRDGVSWLDWRAHRGPGRR